MRLAKELLRVILGAVIFSFVPQLVQAEEVTKEAVVEFVKKASDHAQKVGFEQAYKDFSTLGNEWQKGDLYIFVFGYDGVCLAHGANPKLVGKPMLDVKTADGQLLIQNFIKTVKEQKEGWVTYEWPHPTTKAIEKKTSFVVKVPGADAIMGCGMYVK